ncbi:hypothetical protein ACHAQA_003644 [Verticillium albo-atrum]
MDTGTDRAQANGDYPPAPTAAQLQEAVILQEKRLMTFQRDQNRNGPWTPGSQGPSVSPAVRAALATFQQQMGQGGSATNHR